MVSSRFVRRKLTDGQKTPQETHHSNKIIKLARKVQRNTNAMLSTITKVHPAGFTPKKIVPGTKIEVPNCFQDSAEITHKSLLHVFNHLPDLVDQTGYDFYIPIRQNAYADERNGTMLMLSNNGDSKKLQISRFYAELHKFDILASCLVSWPTQSVHLW